MHETHYTFYTFRCFAARFKFICALLAIFFGAALLTVVTSAWYYDSIIKRGTENYERQITRITADLNTERLINRQKLEELADQMSINADKLDQVVIKAQDAAKKSSGSATKAKSSANRAAKSAAKSSIRITEIVPRDKMSLKENIK